MGFGGGGGGSTSTSYTSQLPEYAKDIYLDQLMEHAVPEFMDTPWAAYGNARYADPSWQEQSARYGMQDMYQNPDMRYEDYANQMLGSAAAIPEQMQGIGSSYQPQSFNPWDIESDYQTQYNKSGQFGAREADFYMNPYQEAVTKTALRSAEDRYQTDRDQRAAKAAGSGGRGGYRQTMMDAIGEGEHQKNIGDIISQSGFQGWGDAQQQFERDRQAQMGSFGQWQENLQAQNQFGMDAQAQNLQNQMQSWQIDQQNRMGRGQQDIDIGLGSNQQMMDMMGRQGELGALGMNVGDQSMASQMQRLDMMNQAGGLDRQDAQRAMDIGYQDFLEGRDWYGNRLGQFAGIMSGMPVTQNSFQRVNMPGPSVMQMGTGLGMAALGGGMFGGGN